MSVELVFLTKSQKALQDVVNLAKSITDGTQVTFSALPVSAEKTDFIAKCVKFNVAVESGNNDKLTITAMSKKIDAGYKQLVAGNAKSASSQYEKELANLKASFLLGESVEDMVAKQDNRTNTALYRKNLLLTDLAFQAQTAETAE
jgi:hypothetical protein